MGTLRLATRGSPLALRQTELVSELLRRAHPGLEVAPLIVRTQGDRDGTTPLDQIGGQGVFVTEVEVAVAEGRADAAVHSAKDMPSVMPVPFVLGAVGASVVVDSRSLAVEAVAGRSVEASATNSPSRSSKSSVGVATVRRERTAREAVSVESPAGAGSPMIASISEALEARVETSTPFTLAMVWRSSRVLDSRSDRSGEGLTAIYIPFVPLGNK